MCSFFFLNFGTRNWLLTLEKITSITFSTTYLLGHTRQTYQPNYRSCDEILTQVTGKNQARLSKKWKNKGTNKVSDLRTSFLVAWTNNENPERLWKLAWPVGDPVAFPEFSMKDIFKRLEVKKGGKPAHSCAWTAWAARKEWWKLNFSCILLKELGSRQERAKMHLLQIRSPP